MKIWRLWSIDGLHIWTAPTFHLSEEFSEEHEESVSESSGPHLLARWTPVVFLLHLWWQKKIAFSNTRLQFFSCNNLELIFFSGFLLQQVSCQLVEMDGNFLIFHVSVCLDKVVWGPSGWTSDWQAAKCGGCRIDTAWFFLFYLFLAQSAGRSRTAAT